MVTKRGAQPVYLGGWAINENVNRQWHTTMAQLMAGHIILHLPAFWGVRKIGKRGFVSDSKKNIAKNQKILNR